MNIRKVEPADAEKIAGIYNYYIQNTHHTFETDPVTGDEMRARIAEVTENYPFLVAEDDEGEVCGYAYAAQFKMRTAYEYAVELTIYVQSAAKQKGIGTSLYTQMFDELAETHAHVIIAGIALPNDSSVRFHERLGFTKVAHFREIGYKLGRWVDVGYWQMMNRL